MEIMQMDALQESSVEKLLPLLWYLQDHISLSDLFLTMRLMEQDFPSAMKFSKEVSKQFIIV